MWVMGPLFSTEKITILLGFLFFDKRHCIWVYSGKLMFSNNLKISTKNITDGNTVYQVIYMSCFGCKFYPKTMYQMYSKVFFTKSRFTERSLILSRDHFSHLGYSWKQSRKWIHVKNPDTVWIYMIVEVARFNFNFFF